MDKLLAIPPIYRVAIISVLILYAIIINIEWALGSQRYTLTVTNKGENAQVKTMECLGTLAAITEELKLEQKAEVGQVSREKMHVFSKWLTCGVL